MLFLPVDLFSPYIEGRERAISANWNDLNQANQVESGYLKNDAQQMNNWLFQDTYGDKLATSNAGARVAQNKALGSDLNAQVALVGQPAALANANLASSYQTALSNAVLPNVQQMANNQAAFQLGQTADAAARGSAMQKYSNQLRPAQVQNQVAGTNTAAAQLQYQNALLQQQAAQLQQQQAAQLQQQQLSQLPAAPQAIAAAPQQAQQVTAPFTTTDANGADVLNIYNVAGRLAPGQTATVAGLQVGRDEQGVYYILNNAKYRVNMPQTPAGAVPNNPLFSFPGGD